MTWIAWRGIELSALVQQLLFVAEVIVILLFAGLAFAHLGEAEGSITPSLEWFNPFELGFGTLAAGVLLGLFIYWGWDTGVSINEETEKLRRDPGHRRGGLHVDPARDLPGGRHRLAGLCRPGAIADQDVFEALGDPVMGDLVFLLEVAIVLSAAASTQTTIMPSARVALSMARRESIPPKFGEIHPRFQTPSFATIFTGVVACVWTVFLLVISPGQTVLADSVTAVGFAICFYYGGTALAGAWYFRKKAFANVRHFIELLVLPLMGGVLMFAVFAKAFFEYLDPENAGSSVLGLGTPIVIGIGGLLMGIPFMLAAQGRYPRFFKNETMPSLESYQQNQAHPEHLADAPPAS